MSENIKSFKIIFFGLVQGVGFRFTSRSIANNLKLKGYAKNLQDGTVEVLLIGTSDKCDSFIEKIKDNMSRYIQNVDIVEANKEEKFKEFSIRF